MQNENLNADIHLYICPLFYYILLFHTIGTANTRIMVIIIK